MNIYTKLGDAAAIKDYNSIDFCTSINVLEHIYPEDLNRIFQNLRTMSREGAIHYHSFGCYDHFYHVDKSISKFNYLKYSEQQWKLIDNDIQPQNRKRVDYFENLFRKNGFRILENLNSNPNFEELKKLKEINKDFHHIPEEQLGVDYGTYVIQASH